MSNEGFAFAHSSMAYDGQTSLVPIETVWHRDASQVAHLNALQIPLCFSPIVPPHNYSVVPSCNGAAMPTAWRNTEPEVGRACKQAKLRNSVFIQHAYKEIPPSVSKFLGLARASFTQHPLSARSSSSARRWVNGRICRIIRTLAKDVAVNDAARVRYPPQCRFRVIHIPRRSPYLGAHR